ncbi:MAG: glutaminase A [Methylocystis sp.]|uniref:glutaminase A n=1 Tax=Methylocystis sp. TaxID=1911079 RepID=UPI003DA525EA
MPSPLNEFLEQCHASFHGDDSGAVADYIPELTKADPAHFGISLATMDGHVYEVGDSAVPFTIQSISKAFVFALALERLGHDRVEKVIGVEPSGEAFNSIRLTHDNRPFNPMVNAGAIACSGLIHEVERDGAFELIHETLSRFAGRRLDIDDAVYLSERATGDRNRAIAWLLHNYDVLKCDVDSALDVYFRQCAILVTARDLAVMAATLANGGRNPVTEAQIISPYAVARTLSVMTSSGMYDYAGEWVYRVGIPAKSGVGGGIIASLPAQLGLGTFSPRLDDHGNSARGLKVCEALSAHFGLHVLNRSDDIRTCVIADYNATGLSSRRNRMVSELKVLEERSGEIRILELVGALSFATMDFVSRRLAQDDGAKFVVIDLRRTPSISLGAGLLADRIIESFTRKSVIVIFSGFDKSSPLWPSVAAWAEKSPNVRHFQLLDDAIEWAEDQVVFRYSGFDHHGSTSHLSEQALLAGLTSAELDEIAALGRERSFKAGERIIRAADKADALFFLQKGVVSIKLSGGARLASLIPGMVFGEMSLLESERSADVWADTTVHCLELPLTAYGQFRSAHPRSAERIMANLAKLLAGRLVLANSKVEVLSNY